MNKDIGRKKWKSYFMELLGGIEKRVRKKGGKG